MARHWNEQARTLCPTHQDLEFKPLLLELLHKQSVASFVKEFARGSDDFRGALDNRPYPGEPKGSLLIESSEISVA
jgi:hypothetical protein